MKHSIIKNGLILAGFALVTTLLIAATHALTQDTIAQQVIEKRLSILQQIIAPQSYNNDIQHDCSMFTSKELLGSDMPQHIYRARQNGNPVAAAIEATAPDGYSGKIEIIVGVLLEGTVSGVRVLQHKETPGLGDKIELRISDWITDFTGLELTEANRSSWQVSKDGGQFDQFTGATITPRAVVAAVRRTLDFYRKNQELIFSQTTPCDGIQSNAEQQEN